MTSDLILPPVSPVMIIRDRHGNQVEPSYEKMCSLHDPGCPECRDVELHYRRSDLATIEPFDLALSFEQRPARFYVASRRVYDVCKRHNLQAGWMPVRIDE